MVNCCQAQHLQCLVGYIVIRLPDMRQHHHVMFAGSLPAPRASHMSYWDEAVNSGAARSLQTCWQPTATCVLGQPMDPLAEMEVGGGRGNNSLAV